MTKAELVHAFKEATGLTTIQSGEYLNRLGDIMAAELLGGGEIPLPGIGKLYARQSAARTGRNPQTGEALQIPARRGAVFKAGKSLKDALKG